MKNLNKEVTEYFAKYDNKFERLEEIRKMIHTSIPSVDEKLWWKVPCFYTEEKNIVIRVFQNHINFITDNVLEYKEQLHDYKITTKGMLQIFDEQELPLDVI